MVLAFVTCERSFLKARHSLRNTLPAGQLYSSASSFQWNPIRFVGNHHNTVVGMQVYTTEFHHGLFTAKVQVRALNVASPL